MSSPEVRGPARGPTIQGNRRAATAARQKNERARHVRVDRRVRRVHGEWRVASSWRVNVSPHVEQRYFSTKKSKIAMAASTSTKRATTATEVDGAKLRSDAAT